MTDASRHLDDELRIYEAEGGEWELSMWRSGRFLYAVEQSQDKAKVDFAGKLMSRCLNIPLIDHTIYAKQVA